MSLALSTHCARLLAPNRAGSSGHRQRVATSPHAWPDIEGWNVATRPHISLRVARPLNRGGGTASADLADRARGLALERKRHLHAYSLGKGERWRAGVRRVTTNGGALR